MPGTRTWTTPRGEPRPGDVHAERHACGAPRVARAPRRQGQAGRSPARLQRGALGRPARGSWHAARGGRFETIEVDPHARVSRKPSPLPLPPTACLQSWRPSPPTRRNPFPGSETPDPSGGGRQVSWPARGRSSSWPRRRGRRGGRDGGSRRRRRGGRGRRTGVVPHARSGVRRVRDRRGRRTDLIGAAAQLRCGRTSAAASSPYAAASRATNSSWVNEYSWVPTCSTT